ncbi:nicotinate-nucleotide adenylyltransferase [Acetobacter sp.]|uniref:nicotinate-nucleotide adenylyltransferase n=1 Tax=Acetobacter sp. TaxID=440 RepID=UPI0039EAA3EE
MASHHDTIPIRGDRRALRIGLLGGSFNPAHEGHIQIALRALHLLDLDQVWLMVSPGNPLKPRKGMAPFAERFATVERLATDRRLIPTDIEAWLGTRYASDTVRALRRRFPRAHFVWLMGTDVFAELPRWHHWKAFLRQVPLAVMPRPGSNAAALHGRVAARLSHCRLSVGRIRQLPVKTPPVWAFLPGPQNGISATALRRAGQTESLFRTDRAATRQETRS